MKFNQRSWYVWLYQSSYGLGDASWNLPNNLCPFFWKLVLAIVLFPLAILIHIVNIFVKREANAIGIGSGISILCAVICFAFITDGKNVHFHMTLSWFLIHYGYAHLILLATIGSIAIFALIVEGIKLLIKKFSKPKEYKPKQPSIIATFIKAKYNKYCPKIEWTK